MEDTRCVEIKLPYSEMIVGITGCGKTYYLLKRLEKIMDGKIMYNKEIAGNDKKLTTLVVLDDCAMGKDVKVELPNWFLCLTREDIKALD